MFSQFVIRLNLCRILPRLLSGLCILIVAGSAIAAEPWSGTLYGGGKLEVDSETRRAVRYQNGTAVPMWDGTHRLDDGSVVIVRDGAAVPTESMIDAWRAPPPMHPALAGRYCDQLVRKVCGYDNACSFDEACVRARQLLRDEREEQRRMPLESGMHPRTMSSGSCSQALMDMTFPACAQGVAVNKNSPCDLLVLRVCGQDDVCANRQACGLARQLLGMETEERLVGTDPNAPTATAGHCREAMANSYFSPCEQP